MRLISRVFLLPMIFFRSQVTIKIEPQTLAEHPGERKRRCAVRCKARATRGFALIPIPCRWRC
jgi:hypothetical protein